VPRSLHASDHLIFIYSFSTQRVPVVRKTSRLLRREAELRVEMFLICAAYSLMFVFTWGAFYAYFTNTFPTLDNPQSRRETLAFSVFLGLLQPVAFILALFYTGFLYHGFQWSGGPKRDRTS
jgi:hypothetical protein